ncbi:MAG: hypothetical protein ACREDO_02110 [Methyloceanibacter sp.]
MADQVKRPGGMNTVLVLLLVVALAGLGVLGFLYYRQQQDIVKIDVPGFSGKVTKGEGVDIEMGKDRKP